VIILLKCDNKSNKNSKAYENNYVERFGQNASWLYKTVGNLLAKRPELSALVLDLKCPL